MCMQHIFVTGTTKKGRCVLRGSPLSIHLIFLTLAVYIHMQCMVPEVIGEHLPTEPMPTTSGSTLLTVGGPSWVGVLSVNTRFLTEYKLVTDFTHRRW